MRDSKALRGFTPLEVALVLALFLFVGSLFIAGLSALDRAARIDRDTAAAAAAALGE